MPEQPSPRFITAAEVATVDIPPGGSTGQVLAKQSNADRDVDWESIAGTGDVVGPGSATDGHLALFDGVTGKLIKDGGAPGGGGSFLSANTARVDPSGNDGTGEVGDLSKPFLTVQAALTAIVANEFDTGLFGGVIYLPATNLVENLTMTVGDSVYVISFIGQRGPASYTFNQFASLTINQTAETSATVEIYIENGSGDEITIGADASFFFLRNFYFNGGTVALSGSGQEMVMGSFDNSAGDIDALNAMGASAVTLFGMFAKEGGTSIACDGNVFIEHCRSYPNNSSYDGFNVDDGTGTGSSATVVAIGVGTVMGDVTALDITFKDARSNGTITSENDPPVTYDDLFLKAVPPGGTTADRLEKASETDFDTTWVTPA